MLIVSDCLSNFQVYNTITLKYIYSETITQLIVLVLVLVLVKLNRKRITHNFQVIQYYLEHIYNRKSNIKGKISITRKAKITLYSYQYLRNTNQIKAIILQNMELDQEKKEELVVFKYKRDADEDIDLDTLVFNRSKKMIKNTNNIQMLTKRIQKIAVDQSVFCLKKINLQNQPELANLIFRSRDLAHQKRAQIRKDLINGLRSRNFPETIKVCQIEDDWVPYKPAAKKKGMQIQAKQNYYVLARDVIDEDKSYQEIQKPRQLVDYMDSSQGQIQSDQIDSQDSNRQQNPDNDYPDQDYDYDQEDYQQQYGEYNPYDSGDDSY